SPTSRLVHIVNHDTVPGYLFLIRSTDSPKIVSARHPAGSCVLTTSRFFVTSWHTEYRAKCRATLSPGRTLNIRVTVRGAGTLGVLPCPAHPAAGPCRF